jgi:hypothetical protein
MSEFAYQDFNALVMLYTMGDLPEDTKLFQYYIAPGKLAWAHIDEIKKQVVLSRAYPGANTQKAKEDISSKANKASKPPGGSL